jgi:hypothetical protein
MLEIPPTHPGGRGKYPQMSFRGGGIRKSRKMLIKREELGKG